MDPVTSNSILSLKDDEFEELETLTPEGELDLESPIAGVSEGETSNQNPQDPPNELTSTVQGDDPEPVEQPKEAPINYEEAYKQIMAPFKANGTTFTVRSPQEAVTLMQKGANYTSKMQELAPQRKLLKMLKNNNLLNEADVEFLIELKNKNPEAVKKYLRDSQIDPLDIDTSEEPKYQAGRQSISDEEMAFDSVLNDLEREDGGYDTIREMNSNWDQQSKKLLLQYPETMLAIHQQRKSGQYNLISDEVKRLKILGTIPENTPFLVAYREVKNAFDRQAASKPRAPTPIARGVNPAQTQLQKQSVDTRLRAAAPTRVANANNRVTYKNPFSMSDEEIENFKF